MNLESFSKLLCAFWIFESSAHVMRCCDDSFSWTNSCQDWCSNVGVVQDKGGPAAVNAIKALALNARNTFFINAAVMLWKSNAIIRGTRGAAGVEGAIASSGLPVTLAGCPGWWWSRTLHPTTCRKEDKKSRRLCPCHLAVYHGCFSPKVVSQDLHVSRYQNLVTCCIQVILLPSCRHYRKPV